jgi:hypothetical protein
MFVRYRESLTKYTGWCQNGHNFNVRVDVPPRVVRVGVEGEGVLPLVREHGRAGLLPVAWPGATLVIPDSTLPLAVIGCHSFGIHIQILLALLPFSVKMTASPAAAVAAAEVSTESLARRDRRVVAWAEVMRLTTRTSHCASL